MADYEAVLPGITADAVQASWRSVLPAAEKQLARWLHVADYEAVLPGITADAVQASCCFVLPELSGAAPPWQIDLLQNCKAAG